MNTCAGLSLASSESTEGGIRSLRRPTWVPDVVGELRSLGTAKPTSVWFYVANGPQ